MSRLTDQIPSYMPAWRRIKDRAATVAISAGGSGVLLAILLIFFYLVYEVLPLFAAASLENANSSASPLLDYSVLYTAVEEQGELGLAIAASGRAVFFEVSTGQLRQLKDLGLSDRITVVSTQGVENRLLGLGLADGSVTLIRHEYRLSYPEDRRLITPRIDFPYAGEEFSIGTTAVRQLALFDGDEALLLAGLLVDGQLVAKRVEKKEDFLSGDVVLSQTTLRLPQYSDVAAIHLSEEQRWLYVLLSDGRYRVIDLLRKDANGVQRLVDSGRLFANGARLSGSAMLLGGISLLAASEAGDLVQYFMVASQADRQLQEIRRFETDGVVVQRLLPEHRRKGFIALGREGAIQVFHTTAARRLLSESGPVADSAAISPRGDLLLLTHGDQLTAAAVTNKHPDISWSALWDEVWYESYDQPEYIWQSSASNNDFEPKYSFSPLAFGTLKAAFYAMLLAAPLAICGAIYTAYFMAPSLRRKVKPLIELMEALPTVILGFLAGLWLAPFVEDKLTGVFTVLLVMPVGILLFAFLWSRMPRSIISKLPEGWHAAILVPVVLFLGWASFAASDSIELTLFGGDMRVWITSELGISFDQRNALVVGIAMGMAVIPTIFSIAEDAIFSVPKHLSDGSLALGATPWQTLVGVILPTASPGIFSGLMIGMGRAVGETMIVLMATGNTPIMDANIFEGMRTLAANIAVEVPEAEVNSTHYRVLFLAAFVLFMFTFVVNTVAELIRQRLRVKYGSL